MPEKITKVNLSNEMENCYYAYAISVLTDRAIPDVRDGLKPVHRRILYAMKELHMESDKQYRKSARIVGEVLGKYHPHGDTSVYDAMVRLAQDFTLRYPLVKGQGNFGSIDGDSAAAMRYTEAKMSKISEELLCDLSKNTVDFNPNFDDSEKEPSVLPARFPNLLVNGTSGIAVGMTSNIPTHNLSEVIDAVIAVIENNDISLDELMSILPGPDFPTGGIINGIDGIKDAYSTGKGKIKLRCKLKKVEGKRGKCSIVINEIPYMTNKSKIVESIADMAKNKKVGNAICDVRDESGRKGISIVIDVKKDFDPDAVINALYKYTDLETTFSCNMLALVDGHPKELTLIEYLNLFINFRVEILTRKLNFELKQLLDRIEILEALIKVLDNIEKAIKIIRKSKKISEAREKLMKTFDINERQATAVLEMKLQKLTNMEKDKLVKELNQCEKDSKKIKSILSSKVKMNNLIKKDLTEIKEKYSDPRQTKINKIEQKTSTKDSIIKQDVVVEMTEGGYIAVGKDENIVNSRRSDDKILYRLNTNTTEDLFIFTQNGKAIHLKINEMAVGSSRKQSEHINSYYPECAALDIVGAYASGGNGVVFITKKGLVKYMKDDEFKNVKRRFISVEKLNPDDQVVKVIPLDTREDLLTIITLFGMGITFNVKSLNSMGKTACGVTGIKLKNNDNVIGAFIYKEGIEQTIYDPLEKKKIRIQCNNFKVQKRAGYGEHRLNLNTIC